MTNGLHQEIASCTICADHLPHGTRPVVQFSSSSKLLIIGQAPGSKVHASGIPWDDDSGNRLRDWLGLDKPAFYDPAKVALIPMGFCYPGKVPKERGGGGDEPPRKECAPHWHDRVLAALPSDRLTLLVGTYAQNYYLRGQFPETKKFNLTQHVENYRAYLPQYLPLPHPAWRSAIWMKKHPWFEEEVLPMLQDKVRHLIESVKTCDLL